MCYDCFFPLCWGEGVSILFFMVELISNLMKSWVWGITFLLFWPHSNRNDLWALGCTLYQMLSGTSPFKDASEWLIFQRIIARDLRFPDYFSEEARDLIDHLLVSYKAFICWTFVSVLPCCFLNVPAFSFVFFVLFFYMYF